MALTPALRDWERQGGLVRYGAHDVFLRAGGAGPTLLLIHGYPTGSYDWHRLWPHLEASHQMVAVDMLGLGLSAKPQDHRYSLAAHADLHEWVLQQLGVQRVHLVAHDLGVSVAQEMLARRRTNSLLPKIASVTLLNGGLFPEAYRPRPIQRLLASPLGWIVGKRISRAAFGRSIAPLFSPQYPPAEGLVDDFWSLVAHRQGLLVAHEVGRFWKDRMAVRDRLVEPVVRKLWPIQMINGLADPNSGAHMAARYRALVPDARIVPLEEVGHWPQLDVPGQVGGLIARFVREHESVASAAGWRPSTPPRPRVSLSSHG